MEVLRTVSSPPGRALGLLLQAPIELYRRVISPLTPPRCRYEPTCSAYALSAIRCRGPVAGLVLAVWRVARCNPWSKGGFDPVPTSSRCRRRRG